MLRRQYSNKFIIRMRLNGLQRRRKGSIGIRNYKGQAGMAALKNLPFFLLWRCDPTRVMNSSFLRFLDHTQLRIKVGRTPLDE